MKQIVISALAFVCALVASQAQGSAPTWSSDVAKIIYSKCTPCHRSGEIAPFTLESYEQAQDYAYSIKRAVSKREMPPWPPAKGHGSFVGDRSLSQDEIDKITAWVDADMPTGDLASAPKPPTFP
ncbi:MAG: alkyl hydroperoxide reductase, partial [Ignavibacteria bacterium]